MKRIKLSVFLVMIAVLKSFSQSIEISTPFVPLPSIMVPPLLTDVQRDHFKTQTTDKIMLKITNVPLPGNLSIDGSTPVSPVDSSFSFDITREIQAALNANRTDKTIEVKNATSTSIGKISIKWNEISTMTEKEKALAASLKNKQKIIDSFKYNYNFKEAYDNKKNSISLYFDETGKLLNYLPVNVDQNDLFYINIVCPIGDETKYRINVIEGEYKPEDLAIRPYDKITIAQSTGGGQQFKAIDYTVVHLRAGPFTSEFFKFQISYDSLNDKIYNGPPYSIRINKLYHVGVGVSIIRSALRNPDFRIAPLNNNDSNTIETFNDGAQTLLTFNVIWYWSVLHQNPKGNVIPSGRDVLKDEPTFSLTRIFPTIGVSLSEKFNENIFLGFVYEFARGGSIISGVHYGKTTQLADKNFELQSSTFTGTADQIRTKTSFIPKLFIGINVDTRIFNTLFSRGQ